MIDLIAKGIISNNISVNVMIVAKVSLCHFYSNPFAHCYIINLTMAPGLLPAAPNDRSCLLLVKSVI